MKDKFVKNLQLNQIKKTVKQPTSKQPAQKKQKKEITFPTTSSPQPSISNANVNYAVNTGQSTNPVSFWNPSQASYNLLINAINENNTNNFNISLKNLYNAGVLQNTEIGYHALLTTITCNNLDFLRHILERGAVKKDRTGIGTISVFSYEMRFNLAQGFPLLTTKKVHLKSVIYELLWFLRGDTNIKYLNENGVTIWDEWADANGNLGPVYGKQWRHWESSEGRSIDQVSELIQQIKTNPDSRRLIISAWNVGELNKMALPPCHLLFQFYVANNKLSCKLTQRSADAFLGVPFNIASYSLLTYMVAQQCNLEVGDFIWSGGDCHIYLNHLEQVKLQLSRSPFPLPQLKLRQAPSIFDYHFEDFVFENYQCHPGIKAPVAV